MPLHSNMKILNYDCRCTFFLSSYLIFFLFSCNFMFCFISEEICSSWSTIRTDKMHLIHETHRKLTLNFLERNKIFGLLYISAVLYLYSITPNGGKYKQKRKIMKLSGFYKKKKIDITLCLKDNVLNSFYICYGMRDIKQKKSLFYGNLPLCGRS